MEASKNRRNGEKTRLIANHAYPDDCPVISLAAMAWRKFKLRHPRNLPLTIFTMFVAENAEVLRKHYDQIVETVNDPVPFYLPKAGKQASAATLDVGQDLF